MGISGIAVESVRSRHKAGLGGTIGVAQPCCVCYQEHHQM